jgi:hypothetical protein
LSERLDFLHPIEDGPVSRLVFTHATGRRNGRSDVFHGDLAREECRRRFQFELFSREAKKKLVPATFALV